MELRSRSGFRRRSGMLKARKKSLLDNAGTCSYAKGQASAISMPGLLPEGHCRVPPGTLATHPLLSLVCPCGASMGTIGGGMIVCGRTGSEADLRKPRFAHSRRVFNASFGQHLEESLVIGMDLERRCWYIVTTFYRTEDGSVRSNDNCFSSGALY